MGGAVGAGVGAGVFDAVADGVGRGVGGGVGFGLGVGDTVGRGVGLGVEGLPFGAGVAAAGRGVAVAGEDGVAAGVGAAAVAATGVDGADGATVPGAAGVDVEIGLVPGVDDAVWFRPGSVDDAEGLGCALEELATGAVDVVGTTAAPTIGLATPGGANAGPVASRLATARSVASVPVSHADRGVEGAADAGEGRASVHPSPATSTSSNTATRTSDGCAGPDRVASRATLTASRARFATRPATSTSRPGLRHAKTAQRPWNQTPIEAAIAAPASPESIATTAAWRPAVTSARAASEATAAPGAARPEVPLMVLRTPDRRPLDRPPTPPGYSDPRT